MSRCKKFSIMFLLLFSISSVFSDGECRIERVSEGGEISCQCDDIFSCREGFEKRVCFYPIPSASDEIIPFSSGYGYEGESIFGEISKIEDIKDPKIFSSKYGGCSLSYSHSDNKISANFRYTTELEENCGDYTSEGQVNKFKCYCDDGDDDFDFSTTANIIYKLKGGIYSDFRSVKTLNNQRIGLGGYSSQGIIGDVEKDIDNMIYGMGTFQLKIEAEITDDKCTSGEKSIKSIGTVLTKSNVPFVELESKKPRLGVLASILHKVTHIKKVGDAQRILSNALQDMSHMDIVKKVDRSVPGKTQITLELTALDDFDRDRDYILYSVLPKDEVLTSGDVNHERAVFIGEDGNPTDLKYSVRDDDPVIDWHFKYVGDGKIEIVYNVPPGSDGGELILLRDKPFAYNAGNLLFNYRTAPDCEIALVLPKCRPSDNRNAAHKARGEINT